MTTAIQGVLPAAFANGTRWALAIVDVLSNASICLVAGRVAF
jgi:hypothetical protein